MSGNVIDLAVEAAAAGNYPENRFNQRERKLLESVKEYVDNSPPNDVITTEGDLIFGDSGGDAARLAVGPANTVLKSDGTTLAYSTISLENLDSGIAPAYFVKYAGSFSTSGGDANETISVPGALSSDLAFVQLSAQGLSPQTVLTAVSATDAIHLVFSADPDTDHTVKYQLLRAAT